VACQGTVRQAVLHHRDGDYDNPVEGWTGCTRGVQGLPAGSYRRVAKADVLDQLPKKIYSVRHVDLPDEWRKAYREMETDMLATLPDGGELPVFSTLAQLTRLLQMASSAFDVTMEMVLDEESARRGRTMTSRCAPHPGRWTC